MHHITLQQAGGTGPSSCGRGCQRLRQVRISFHGVQPGAMCESAFAQRASSPAVQQRPQQEQEENCVLDFYRLQGPPQPGRENSKRANGNSLGEKREYVLVNGCPASCPPSLFLAVIEVPPCLNAVLDHPLDAQQQKGK